MSEAANRPEHPGRDNPGAGGASDVGLAGPVCPGQAGRVAEVHPAVSRPCGPGMQGWIVYCMELELRQLSRQRNALPPGMRER
jgi:hypothetical protein